MLLFFDLNWIIVVLATYSKEIDPSTSGNSIIDNLASNASLIEVLVTVGGIVFGAVGWAIKLIRSQINKKAEEIKEQSFERIDNTDKNAKKGLEDNKSMLLYTKDDLSRKISEVENKLVGNLNNTKETINEIKSIAEKIDEKNDKARNDISINQTKIAGHEARLSSIEKQIFRVNFNRPINHTQEYIDDDDEGS